MNEQQVLEFAEAAKVTLSDTNLKARCVDGRYEGEDVSMIAKPGGDTGDLMAAFGALNELNIQLDPQVVLDAVLTEINGAVNFQFHTDEHAEHDQAGTGMGCGHLKKAVLEPAAYDLTPEQLQFIAQELPGLLERGAHQEVLRGNHAEQATIVVESEHYGLKPLVRTAEGVTSVFVYQKTVHQQQLDKLARELQEKIAATGRPVEEAAVKQALDKAFGQQLAVTLERLAKDLPVYTVSIDEHGNVSL